MPFVYNICMLLLLKCMCVSCLAVRYIINGPYVFVKVCKDEH